MPLLQRWRSDGTGQRFNVKKRNNNVKEQNQQQLGKTLWGIADQLRGSMSADDFRDYMLSFLFLRYLSDNYEAAAKKELEPGLSGNTSRYPEKREGQFTPGNLV